MLLPRREDTVHKSWLLRLLTAICDHQELSSLLAFKGGTCAAMRGFLNRFSVDLDFDFLASQEKISHARKTLEGIFSDVNLKIKSQSAKVPQYFLQYPSTDKRGRNSIKIDSSFPVPKNNLYEMARLPEIDRTIKCQTLETMVANKLIALIGRYEKTGKIAGRDVFDVHHFLFHGYPYRKEIIKECREEPLMNFFQHLIELVERHVTYTLIDEDLNYLLPHETFQAIRKILKQETLMLLRTELARMQEA